MTCLTRLTRHFFHALFDFGVFSQDGADSFVRVVLGLFSLIICLGFLLLRIYASRYGALFAEATAEPYAQALVADTTLAIALPMWTAAFLTVLVSHSLFPDETDFRVLLPLPIGRGLVFGAKLLALAQFAALFALISHVAITPLVLLVSMGRFRMDAPPLALLAFWGASLSASTCALLMIVAVNGLLIVCTPRAYVHAATGALRSAMLGALVLALPFVLALPAQSARLAQHSPLLFLAPPVWFLGVDRVLLGHGDAYFLRLARIAAIVFASAAIIASASYVVLYRRFDRVMLRSFAVSRRRPWRWPGITPARAAVRAFTAATLRRSALHQGVLVGLTACGVGLAMNTLLRGGLLPWLRGIDVPRWQMLGAVSGMPFAMIVVGGVAARAALALPIEPKANWIFRMTEREGIRGDQLHAAERVVTQFAVLMPVALTVPLQWMVAGPRAIGAALLTAVFGLLWTEVLLCGWRRIPFTCSYMPGKRTVSQTSLAWFGVYVTFGLIASVLEGRVLGAPRTNAAIVIAGVLAGVALIVRRRRRITWRKMPLMFDDELPTDVQVFKLNAG